MANLNSTTIQDVTNKMSLSVLSSTNDKNYFEERYSWKPQLDARDIFSEVIPNGTSPAVADANVVANPSMLVKLTGYQLDEIPASNQQGYALFSTPGDTNSPKLNNFLTPQKYGVGYALSLTQQNDTVINLTDGQYQFDYSNGILRFDPASTPTVLGYALPLKVTIYRYIGATLDGGTVSSSNGASYVKIENASGSSSVEYFQLNGIYTFVSDSPITYIRTEAVSQDATKKFTYLTYSVTNSRYEIYNNFDELLYYTDANVSTNLADHTTWNLNTGINGSLPIVSYVDITIANAITGGALQKEDKIASVKAVHEGVSKFLDPLIPVVNTGGSSGGFICFVSDNTITLNYSGLSNINVGEFVYFSERVGTPVAKLDHIGMYKLVARTPQSGLNRMVFHRLDENFFPSYGILLNGEWGIATLRKDALKGIVGIYNKFVTSPLGLEEAYSANRELVTRAGIEEKIASAISIIAKADDITIEDSIQDITILFSTENTLNELIDENWVTGIDYEWAFEYGTLTNGRLDSEDNTKGTQVLSFEDTTDTANNKVWDEGFYVLYSNINFDLYPLKQLQLNSESGFIHEGFNHGLEGGLYKYSFYVAGTEDERRIIAFMMTTGDATVFHAYFANMSLYPVFTVHKIKNINYIIDEDFESIDGSDTPMSDPNSELVTRAYVDNSSGVVGYTQVFTNTDLISGELSVAHNLSAQDSICHITVKDDNDKVVVPDDITFVNANTLTIDFRMAEPINGSWVVLVTCLKTDIVIPETENNKYINGMPLNTTTLN